MTDCTREKYTFQGLSGGPRGKREVEGRFDGGAITSDGGAMLLREADKRLGILKMFTACFTDHRRPEWIEREVYELLAQRLYGLALGYEDLNDHDTLRHDPLLAVAAEKADPTGQNRRKARDRGKALAGKSTLNRLELTPPDATSASRYKKIVADTEKIDRAFVDVFLAAHATAPKRIVLDLDATDNPLHGQQEGRFFNGYYDCFCYLPLYIFCDDHLLCARLRPADQDASAGTIPELERIVEQIRAAWPKVEIAVRGDSGFCREEIMAWCETNNVHYIFGLARNPRLLEAIVTQMKKAMKRYAKTGQPARVYRDFRYKTLKTWSRRRRVVGKAEYLPKGRNPRFVVTSYGKKDYDAAALYEKEYCARGDMENRIKEQQLYLFADSASAHLLRTNQLRLYFSSMTYVLLSAFRRLALAGTELAKAQCETIRVKLLKIGGLIQITARRVYLSFASACPFQSVFKAAYDNLQRLPLSSA